MAFRTKSAAVLLLAMLMILPACSSKPDQLDDFPVPSSSGSSVTFAPETLPPSAGEKAIIIEPMPADKNLQGFADRINDALGKQGLNVLLAFDPEFAQETSEKFDQKLARKLSSENPAADAYIVYSANISDLENGTQPMDLTELLPTIAPDYYTKYKALFKEKITGIPIGIIRNNFQEQPSFMLRKDIEDRLKPQINTLGDVLSFLEAAVISPKKTSLVSADPQYLVQLWAMEKGYYSLKPAGIGGYLFARMDDPGCKLIALERIPEFYDFLKKMTGMFRKGYLSPPYSSPNGWENIGAVRSLGDYFNSDYTVKFAWIRGEFIAHELYAGQPCYNIESLSHSFELLIPSASAKAAYVIKFIDWLYSSQQNYTSVVYGEDGVDYKEIDGRITILNGGSPVDCMSMDAFASNFTALPFVVNFGNTDYNLLPANAPSNFEQVFNYGKVNRERYAMDLMLANAGDEGIRLLRELPSDMQAVIKERERLIDAMIMGYSDMDYTMNIKPLENLKNDWLLEQYFNMISKLVKN